MPKRPAKQATDAPSRIVYIVGTVVVLALLTFSFSRILKSGRGANPAEDGTAASAIAAAVDPPSSEPSAPAALPPLASARPDAKVPPAGTLAASFAQPVAAEPPLDLAAIPRSTPDDVLAKFEAGAVTIIDVRDKDEYVYRHIPGALQIPLSYVAGEAPYLPKDKPIVLYCTCPNEESSGAGAMRLIRAGLTNVTALKGGLQEWINRGYPTESGMPAK